MAQINTEIIICVIIPVCRVMSILTIILEVIINFARIYISNQRQLSFIFGNFGDSLYIFCRLVLVTLVTD